MTTKTVLMFQSKCLSGNPPTMFITMHAMLSHLDRMQRQQKQQPEQGEHESAAVAEEVQAVKDFFSLTMPRLHQWFQWFNTSQLGMAAPGYE